MKTVRRFLAASGRLTMLAVAAGFIALPALAQQGPAAPTAPVVSAPVVAAPVLAPSAPSVPIPSPLASSPTLEPSLASPAPVANFGKTTTPASVDEVLNGLRDNANTMSLEDLAKAQDTVQRLNMILEIERKLGDISKAKDARQSGGVAAIPAASLGLPPKPVTLPSPVKLNDPDDDFAAPRISSASYKLERVLGADGRYTAIVNTGVKTISVRSGDKLPDGSTVAGITPTSVKTKGRGGERVLRLENVVLNGGAR